MLSGQQKNAGEFVFDETYLYQDPITCMPAEDRTVTIRQDADPPAQEVIQRGVLILFSEGDVPGSGLYPGEGYRVLGRDVEQTIYITDPALSRKHASLELQTEKAWVEDLKSHNGTFVNGQRLRERRAVGPGDIIRCGNTLLTIVSDAALFTNWPQSARIEPLLGGPQIKAVREKIEVVAPLNVDVLLTGETGTGKEIAARVLHEKSGRAGRMVMVNCAAVPEALFEAELFGVKRGAFTGAVADRPGLMRSAQRGTLFLDEIGELPASLQAKLLRAVEQREIRAVGGDNAEQIDVRLIVATHRDLEQEVAKERFRADLYHRLCGANLSLPPLRQRPEDIVLYAERTLSELQSPAERVMKFSVGFIEQLLLYDWPGNVRELQRAVREAMIQARIDGVDTIGVKELRRDLVHREEDNADLGRVRQALWQCQGNVAQASLDLRIPRAKIYALLKAAGLRAEDFRR
jgi:transcriptional regulator of acetoin/glycerol metabolism